MNTYQSEIVPPMFLNTSLFKKFSTINFLNLRRSESFDMILPDAEIRFQKKVEGSGLYFENKKLPLSVKPVFINSDLSDSVEEKFEKVIHILDKIPHLYQSSEEVRRYFRLDNRVENMLLKCKLPDGPIFIGRFDFAIDQSGSPKIYEFNTAAPAAFLLSNEIRKIHKEFLDNTHLADFYKMKFCNMKDTSGIFSNALFSKVKVGNSPTIALLNSKFNTMETELKLMAKEITDHGGKPFISFIEDLEFSNEHILVNGQPVDLVYIKIDIKIDKDFDSPFTKNKCLVEKFINVTNQGTQIANSLYAYWLIDNKSTLNFVKSDLFKKHLNQQEIDLIDEVIPQTFMLDKISTPTLQDIFSKKSKYVLKKSHDTRGRSVIIGKEVCPEKWKQAVLLALNSDENYVVQEYIKPECNLTSKGVRYTTYSTYLINGVAMSWISRTSPSEVTNVGQDGFLQMVYKAQPNEEIS